LSSDADDEAPGFPAVEERLSIGLCITYKGGVGAIGGAGSLPSVAFFHGRQGWKSGSGPCTDFPAARNSRGSCVDSEDAAGETLSVQLFHGAPQVVRVLKFHETESPGMTGHPIADDLRKSDFMAVLFKPLTKFDLTASMGNISDKQSQHSLSF
jgi:hypothetical protein